MAEVIWSEPALNELDAIADYIALDNPEAARRLVQRVFHHVAEANRERWEKAILVALALANAQQHAGRVDVVETEAATLTETNATELRLTAGVLHFLSMKLVTGKVENGKVTLPEGEFEEGAAVAVLASMVDEPVGLTPAEEEALIESLTAIRSGNYISSEDLLLQLRLRGR